MANQSNISDEKKLDAMLKQYELVTKSYDEYLKIFYAFTTTLMLSVAISIFLNNSLMADSKKLFWIFFFIVSINFLFTYHFTNKLKHLLKVKCKIENDINRLFGGDFLFGWGINTEIEDRPNWKKTITILIIITGLYFFLYNIL